MRPERHRAKAACQQCCQLKGPHLEAELQPDGQTEAQNVSHGCRSQDLTAPGNPRGPVQAPRKGHYEQQTRHQEARNPTAQPSAQHAQRRQSRAPENQPPGHNQIDQIHDSRDPKGRRHQPAAGQVLPVNREEQQPERRGRLHRYEAGPVCHQLRVLSGQPEHRRSEQPRDC